MSDFTISVPTTKQVACKILRFKWYPPVANKELENLPCGACQKTIGKNKWALIWGEVNGKERPLRLCEQCGRKGEPK